MKRFFIIFLLFMMVTGVTNAATFSDIEGMNCEFAVERIAYLGIVNGTSENIYSPKKAVTRAEFAKMITNIMGGKSGTNVKNFSDIDNHWGKMYIQNAASRGYINGYTDGTFKPDKEVSYAEAITIIMRCLGYDNLENKASGAWYDNYISEMRKIDLDSELDEFSPNDLANRGDIAIILWNMIHTDLRLEASNGGLYKYNSDSILEEMFSSYNFVDNVTVNSITAKNGKIVYVTSKGDFYKETNIDFSNLGGTISGFYDTKTNSFVGLKIDEGLNVKKISGSVKDISDMGYSIYTVENIWGYGDKDHAEYAEVFVDEDTDEIIRVVYYDTRESHFAEKIKIGSKKVTIESRDFYDHSIVILKDGTKITYDILRTESVKDIDLSALLINDGKIVDWTTVPDNTVVREIEKNKVYTYTHKYIDGILKRDKTNLNSLKLNDKKYVIQEDCICQNTITKQTMKLVEGLTVADLDKIGEEEKNTRIYLNEFDEVVKLEFGFDIWKMHEQEVRDEKVEELETYLKNVGIISNVLERFNEDEGKVVEKTDISVYLYKDEKTKDYDDVAGKDFKVGDLVYIPSGESEWKIVTQKLEIETAQIAINCLYPITERGIGNYYFDENTKFFEVLLERDTNNKNEHTKATVEARTLDMMAEYSRYKNIYVVATEDGIVLKLFALKEVGSSSNFGIINDIKVTISGDSIVSTMVYVKNENGSVKRYHSDIPITGFDIGDIVTYTLVPKKGEEKEDGIVIGEVYRHEHIGNKYDLIVDSVKDKKYYFVNSDIIFDMNLKTFEFDGEIYDFDDYAFLNLEVEKDEETGEWKFTKLQNKKKAKFIVNEGYRFVINEITGTIIAYKGYKEN